MRHDVVIVGGAFAGLAAAIYLARARRRVCVIDTAQPRNRFAGPSHGFLGFDGSDPLSILATARGQVAAYPTVTLIEAEATAARAKGAGFAVTFDRRRGLGAQGDPRLRAAGHAGTDPRPAGALGHVGFALSLPPRFEFADRPLGVLFRSPMSVHQAYLVSEWGPTTLLLNGAALDAESAVTLATHAVSVEPGRLKRPVGEGSALSALELEDGSAMPVAALYVALQSSLASPIAEQLGAVIDDGPMGPLIRTDADKMTSVPGLYAAGDIARAPHSVSWAVADGATAGTAARRALVFG